MGFKERGKRTGEGPFRDSWQRKQHGDIGKRQETGEPCPQKPQKDQPNQPEKK